MSANPEPASTGKLPVFSISLTQQPYADHPFSRRYIVLDTQNPTLKIGRSSKLAAKGFVPNSQNGWYDSAVMSRQHAEIIADFTQKRLKLRDLGSLHGTYVNDTDQRLEKDQQVEIKDGDSIRFGVDIMRKRIFPPTVVKLGLDYIEVPKAQPEQDSTRPRASSTFKVPDGSDSDMDEESNNDSPAQGIQSVGRGLSGLSYKGDVIDLTHPVTSGNVITNLQKRVIDLDQDDDYESDWCASDEIDALQADNGTQSQPNIPSIQPPRSPIDSNYSNYGWDGENDPRQNVVALQPTALQNASAAQYPTAFENCAAPHDDDDDLDSDMSSDYEPEYDPESVGSDVSGDDGSSERGFQYDYPYSESDSDFSAGQESDEESESQEGGIHWDLPDLASVETGLAPETKTEETEAGPNHDKGHGISRLVTPDMNGDAITYSTSPANFASLLAKPVADPGAFLSLCHPRDVQLATPKSNKSAGDSEEASSTHKRVIEPVVEMTEAHWYPSDKAEFFEARKENKVAVMEFPSPVVKEYSRLAISDIMDEDVPVGKGKRKAEAISSSTEEELAWDAGEVMEVDNDKEVAEPIKSSTEDEEVNESMKASAEVTTIHPLDVPASFATCALRLNDDSDRPSKRQRLRNIAERVGYVALGGVATGAMMFGALVYTAPTFV